MIEKSMKKTLVQMKLNEDTINAVLELKNLLELNNRAQIVAQSIDFYRDLVKGVKDGDRVIIEHKNGEKEILKFINHQQI